MARSGKRGFGSMDPEVQRKYAVMGGKAAHANGTAHVWDSAEAKAAGRKGGLVHKRKMEARAHGQEAGSSETPDPTAEQTEGGSGEGEGSAD